MGMPGALEGLLQGLLMTPGLAQGLLPDLPLASPTSPTPRLELLGR